MERAHPISSTRATSGSAEMPREERHFSTREFGNAAISRHPQGYRTAMRELSGISLTRLVSCRAAWRSASHYQRATAVSGAGMVSAYKSVASLRIRRRDVGLVNLTARAMSPRVSRAREQHLVRLAGCATCHIIDRT